MHFIIDVLNDIPYKIINCFCIFCFSNLCDRNNGLIYKKGKPLTINDYTLFWLMLLVINNETIF